MSFNILELRQRVTDNTAAMDKMLEKETEFSQADFDKLLAETGELRTKIDNYEAVNGFRNDAPTDDSGSIGMEDKELRDYSLSSAILAAASNDWSAAGLEQRASRAVEEKTGKRAQGFFVPSDVMEYRDVDTTTSPVIESNHLTKSLIDILRSNLVLQSVGTTVLSGLSGTIPIPRISSSATAQWVGEGSAPTKSNLVLDQVQLTPHTVAATTVFSRRFVAQTSFDVERMVRSDLAAIIARALDKAGLAGDSAVDANQPDGVLGNAANTASGAWDFDAAVALETLIASDNADVANMSYIMSPANRGSLKTIAAIGTDGPAAYMSQMDKPLNGYSVAVTTQLPDDKIIFGNWSSLIMGLWSGLDIIVNPYTFASSGGIEVNALQDADFAIKHDESFAVHTVA